MTCANESAINIIRGEDRAIALQIVDSSGDPFSLVGVTEIEAKFKNADGSILSKKMTTSGISVLLAAAGKILVSITDTESALLKVNPHQSFHVIVDIGATKRFVNYNKVLTVVEPSI